MTAKEWRQENPELAKKGNIRDYTDLLHLVLLSNIEVLNDSMIDDNISQKERIEKEKQLGVDKIREQFDSIINNLKPEDLDEIEDGVLPSAIEKLVVLDPKTSRLMSKEFDDVVIATIYDLFDLREYLINKKVEEIEQESAVTEQ